MSSYIKKNGLLYSEDLYTVLGFEDTTTDFTGRVPFGAHRIDDEVFTDCPYDSISLPDSVTELGKALFANSKSLEKVKLPSGVTELPAGLFSGCSALKKVTMPNAVSSFPQALFKGCESLQEIPFRAGITSLPESVFEGCRSIKSLVIPPTVRRIEARAVADCTSLESVVFPDCLEYVAPDAFEGCSSLHNLRVDGDSGLFYIGEEDGFLYEAADEGDRIVLRTNGVPGAAVSFFKDNADEVSAGFAEVDDEDFEDDDTFSPEIGASEEETGFIKEEKSEAAAEPAFAPAPAAETVHSDAAVDSMLADIMGDEQERNSLSQEIGVSERETELLSEAMSVMADSSQAGAAGVTDSELEKLFAKNEEDEFATHNADNPEVLDSKAQILTDSVGLSQIIECEPAGELPDDPELYVIAEKLARDENGKNNFSSKLIACCKYFAKIQDYKRIIMLYGLPMDNEEFSEFFKYFISKKNVVLACEAESPSTLSDFGKTICDYARISLKKEELAEQRRTALIKTKTLVKLVIRDKYE